MQDMFGFDRQQLFSIPRIPEEDEDVRDESSTSLTRRGFEGDQPVLKSANFSRDLDFELNSFLVSKAKLFKISTE
jgi:hypothetical protein